MTPTKTLEVHEHLFTSGPRSRISGIRLIHSHPGGTEPHKHEHTGPASFTIDKDEWARKTGLKGGGRKKFTDKPTGEQLPMLDLEDWQKTFKLIIAGPPTPELGEGPGIALPMRLMLQFGMSCEVVNELDGAR